MINRKIKVIWDFKGEDAEQTAQHHSIHLKDFSIKEKLSLNEVGVNNLTEFHSIAFLNVMENEVLKVRDALIPDRAEIV